ncbi:MAG: PrsW family glutamic-type intramembrane protease [Patescibacteria group bacterium]
MSTLLYAALAGIVPSLVWLFFWTREDIAHPESRMILTVSFFGGMIAVVAAILGEKYVADIFTDTQSRYIAWAAIEEVVKLLAVVICALLSSQNDEPIDAMIYCITVALGFAALENTLFITTPLLEGNVWQGVVMGNMRFMGSTLVHVVSSALIGFALGWTFYRGYLAKIIGLIVGLGLAITFHSAFNLSIIAGGATNTLRTFAWVWVGVVILIMLFEEVKVVHRRLRSQG